MPPAHPPPTEHAGGSKLTGSSSFRRAKNFYISFYDQDPEWVAFIQQELNHNTPLEDILATYAYF